MLTLLDYKAKVETVNIPDGPTVHVRMLSGAERAKLYKLTEAAKRDGTEADLNTHLVILCACNADGSSLYTSADFDRLNSLPAPVLDLVATAASKLNALLADSVAESKKS